jgi:hypothetical protein
MTSGSGLVHVDICFVKCPGQKQQHRATALTGSSEAGKSGKSFNVKHLYDRLSIAEIGAGIWSDQSARSRGGACGNLDARAVRLR